MARKEPVLVSAHRCGAGDDKAGENGLHALWNSVEMGADYVEFDVQRLFTGEFVVSHDVPHEGVELVAYESVLKALSGRAGAHIDLKFDSPAYLYDDASLPHEIDAIRQALDLMGGPERIVVTTGHVHSVRALRDWADDQGIDLLVGLSLGRDTRGMHLSEALGVRRHEFFPGQLIERSRANLVCAHHVLASATVARWARHHSLPLLVWTVDDGPHLRMWLRPGAAWMVTSNHPQLALSLRRF
jgi:glycerophosphoryl diester phosphodiesterase